MGTDEERHGRGSLKEQVSSTVRTFLAYLQIRTQLFALEAKEASRELSGKAVFIGIGGVLLFLGYVLFLAGLIGMMEEWWNWNWKQICVGVGLLHLLVGAILIRVAKEKFSKPMFEATLNELEKDREWLTKNSPSNDKRRN